MKPITLTIILMFLLCSFIAGQQRRDPAKEQKYIDALTRIDKSAVTHYQRGTSLMDEGQTKKAIEQYEKVLEKAPDFDVVLRRLGNMYVEDGFRGKGIRLNLQAVEKERSAYNLLALGRAKSMVVDNTQFPTTKEFREAEILLDDALLLDKGLKESVLILKTEISLYQDDAAKFESLVAKLRKEFPDSVSTRYFSTFSLANQSKFDEAIKEIDKAVALGLDPNIAEQVKRQLVAEKQKQSWGPLSYVLWVIPFIGLWVLGLIVLFVLGRFLSRKTLRQVNSSDPNDIRGEDLGSLRAVYRTLINIAAIYYYLSQPVLVVVILGVAFSLVALSILSGKIFIFALLVLVFVSLASVYYLVKSLVFRQKFDEPGIILGEEEAPKLWSEVKEVAKTIETRPIDEIRLTMTSELAVYERGSFWEKRNDTSKRVLLIGVAVLGGFSKDAFRATLAHEYGHFSNRDTAGGEVAFRVEADIMSFAESMVISGTATWYNIAFHFLRIYHFIFRRISLGATRLQEILADRVAAYHFGFDSLKNGLDHVIRKEIAFNMIADTEIDQAVKQRRRIANLYDLADAVDMSEKALNDQFNEIVNSETSDDDSHPSPADRYRLVKEIRSKEVSMSGGEVWELFEDKDAITSRLNEVIEEQIRENYYSYKFGGDQEAN